MAPADNRWLFIVGPALAGLCLLLDLLTEQGVAVGVMYVLPVLVTLPRNAQRHTFWAALSAVILIFVGWDLSPEIGESGMAAANRMIAIAAVLSAALAIALKHRADGELDVERERRHRVEQELAERRASAQLGEMATVVANEIKNPMTGILGALQVLGRRLPSESSDIGVIDRITARVRALVSWTDELLGYAAPAPARLATIRAERVLRRSIERLRSADPASEIEIELLGSADMALKADPDLLERALVHLLRNAVEATTGQGRVTVQILLERPGWAEILVTDDGPGFPEELLDDHLRPFISDSGLGVGLGLPTVERTVVAHGGRMTVELPAEGGTRVRLLLPTSDEGESSGVSDLHDSPPPPGEGRQASVS